MTEHDANAPLTDDELAAIEAKARSCLELGGLGQAQARNVLRLVAEVRRARATIADMEATRIEASDRYAAQPFGIYYRSSRLLLPLHAPKIDSSVLSPPTPPAFKVGDRVRIRGYKDVYGKIAQFQDGGVNGYGMMARLDIENPPFPMPMMHRLVDLERAADGEA